MTTKHNGRKFIFDIFAHKIENVISKWNEDGTINPSLEFQNTWVDTGLTRQVVNDDGELVDEKILKRYEAYYQSTNEKNGTTIEFEVKPHNRQQFIDAVKSQMMYLKDDIDFNLIHSNGFIENIPFKASPIYEDENIILSNYGYYNRPHFVIKGFAYGLIDFAEAELSPKFGNMGFKFNMEDLDVLPSREGVRYTPKTTAAIVNNYDKNAATVKRMLSEELNETKFLLWLKTANKIANRAGSGNSSDVVSRLSSLTDQSELDFTFNEDFKYSSSFKTIASPLLTLQVVGNNQGKIKREDSDYTNSLKGDSILFQFEPSSSRKTAYLLVSHRELVMIKPNHNYKYLAEAFGKYITGTSLENAYEMATLAIDANEMDDTKRKNIKDYLTRAFKFLTLMLVDDLVPSYDSVEVPEDFKISEAIAEVDVIEALAEERYKKVLAERRANREFYIQTYECSSVWSNTAKLTRKLVKFSELDTIASSGTKLVYFIEDAENAPLLDLINNLSFSKDAPVLDNPNLLLFKIAKSNVNQVKPIGENITDWFFNIKDDKMEFSPLVQDILNNAILRKSNSYKWAAKSKFINEGIHKKIKRITKLNKEQYGSLVENSTIIKDILSLQYKIREYNNDFEDTNVKSEIESFKTKYNLKQEIKEVTLINEEILELNAECEDFNRVYGKFLNSIVVEAIGEELEIILQAKKDQLQFKFKGLHNDIDS